MCSDLSCYQLEIDCYTHWMLYVNLTVTRKQKCRANTQTKVRKESHRMLKELESQGKRE